MAIPTMTLTSGGNSAVIALPKYGLRTSIELALKMRQKYNKQYAIYDAGATYDRRICNATLSLDATYQLALETLYTSSTSARGNALTLTLSASSGFFPFGPDKGDAGAFGVVLLPFSSKGVSASPKDYFSTEISMIATSFPVYSIPADSTDYGTMTIGTVSGIRFPSRFFEPINNFALNVGLSYGVSGIDILDLGETADGFNTALTMRCSEIKAANLISYLTGTARGGTFSLVTAANSYAFQALNGTSGTYTVTLADPNIVIDNPGPDQYDISINLNWTATA